MAFAVFVTHVYSADSSGWGTHHRIPTGLPVYAIEMAPWVRRQAGGTSLKRSPEEGTGW
jgi:hypothetical protein